MARRSGSVVRGLPVTNVKYRDIAGVASTGSYAKVARLVINQGDQVCSSFSKPVAFSWCRSAPDVTTLVTSNANLKIAVADHHTAIQHPVRHLT